LERSTAKSATPAGRASDNRCKPFAKCPCIAQKVGRRRDGARRGFHFFVAIHIEEMIF
jgi:hypothetical protein